MGYFFFYDLMSETKPSKSLNAPMFLVIQYPIFASPVMTFHEEVPNRCNAVTTGGLSVNEFKMFGSCESAIDPVITS